MAKYLSLDQLPYLYKKILARIKRSASFSEVEIVEGTLDANKSQLTLSSNIVKSDSQLEFYSSKVNMGKPYKVSITDATREYNEKNEPISTSKPGTIVLDYFPQTESVTCRIIIRNV